MESCSYMVKKRIEDIDHYSIINPYAARNFRWQPIGIYIYIKETGHEETVNRNQEMENFM